MGPTSPEHTSPARARYVASESRGGFSSPHTAAAVVAGGGANGLTTRTDHTRSRRKVVDILRVGGALRPVATRDATPAFVTDPRLFARAMARA